MEKKLRTDEQLRADVLSILFDEAATAGLNVSVTVKNAVVELSGEVHSELEKWSLEKAASRLWDAAGFVSHLQIRASQVGSSIETDRTLPDSSPGAATLTAQLPTIG
jgi:hypothetical protein